MSTAHGFTDGGRKNRLNQWLAVHALKREDAVIAVSIPSSPHEARPRWAFPPTGLRRSPMPGDPQPPGHSIAPRRVDQLGLDADAPLLGWVGRLSHVKGADIAIAALARLRNNSALLVFVGDGPDRQGARGTGRRTRNCRAGPLCRNGAGSRIHPSPAFDALVLSSRSEGTPMILLETIHAGIPIVASAVGGVPDLLPPGSALLVPPEDPAALAARR